MKKFLWLLLLMPVLASAQSPWDGTWKFNLNTAQFPKKPDVYLLQNGIYECKTCVPPIKIKADGTDQAVTGHPYFDSMAITVVNDHEIKETDKKNGKVVGTSMVTVAPDGKTATFEFTDSSNTNAQPVTGKGTQTRVANGPAGSNAISGSWRTTGFQNLSDNGITFTYKVDGDMLTMTQPTGQSYTANLNGTEAPYKGDPGITSVSVKKMGKNMIEETDKRDSKVIAVTKQTLSADGKSIAFEVTDKLHGTVGHYTVDKQ